MIRNKIYNVNWTDVCAAALYAWVCINTLVWSQTACATVFLQITIYFGIYLAARSIFSVKLPAEKVCLLVLAILGVYESAYAIMQLSGFAYSRHSLYPLTGTFFNPGPLGGFIAMTCAPLIAYYKKSGDSRAFYIALVLTGMTVVTASRAAILAIGICVAIVYYGSWRKYHIWVAAGVIAAIAAIVAINPQSAASRVYMDYMAARSIAEHPFTGTGLNSYLHSLTLQQAAYFSAFPHSIFIDVAGVAEYAFCAPMQVGVELGMPGMALFLLMLCAGLIYLRRTSLFYALLAWVVFSLFSYPLALWEFCVPLSILLALGAAAQKHRSEDEIMVRWQHIAVLISGLVIMCAGAWMLRPYLRAEDEYTDFEYIRNEAFIKDYYELLPWMGENQRFLFNFGKILRDGGRYNDSNAMLRQGLEVSNDPMFMVIMGRNYEDMGLTEDAAHMYEKAYHTLPNRLYPLYRLRQLYIAASDSVNAGKYADMVRDFKPKVPSPAVEEMKRDYEGLYLYPN